MSELMHVAIKLLAEYPHTEFELKCRLEKYCDFSPEYELRIQEIMQQLKEQQLVNDMRVAVIFALRYAHKGDDFISKRLQEKGLDEEMIRQTLNHLENKYSRAFRFLESRNFSKKTLQEEANHFSSSRP